MRAGGSRRRHAQPDTAIQRPLVLLPPWAELITMFTLVPFLWAFDRCAENITGNIREAASDLEKEELIKQLMPSICHRPSISGHACDLCCNSEPSCQLYCQAPPSISGQCVTPSHMHHSRRAAAPHDHIQFMYTIPTRTHSFIMPSDPLTFVTWDLWTRSRCNASPFWRVVLYYYCNKIHMGAEVWEIPKPICLHCPLLNKTLDTLQREALCVQSE